MKKFIRAIEIIWTFFLFIGVTGSIDDFNNVDFWIAFLSLAIIGFVPLEIIYRFLSKREIHKQKKIETQNNTKLCPNCGQSVFNITVICPNCNYDFLTALPARQTAQEQPTMQTQSLPKTENQKQITTNQLIKEPEDNNKSNEVQSHKNLEVARSPQTYIRLDETYYESGNMIYRIDGKPISNEEIQALIKLNYERIIKNQTSPSIKLSEQEQLFFDELTKALAEIKRTITMERLSNGVISVYSNRCYVGKIRLSGRKHWMQILRGRTQMKTISGELDDFIQHIPDWVRYIRLHCD